MANVLIATAPLRGHVGPLLPVARELVARRHRVRWLTGPAFAGLVGQTGAEHHVSTVTIPHPPPELEAVRPFEWDLLNLFIGPSAAQLAELHSALAQPGGSADVIVTDSLFFAARLLHDLGGPPWVTIGVVPMMRFLPSRRTTRLWGRIRRSLGLVGTPGLTGILVSPLAHVQNSIAGFEDTDQRGPQVHFVGSLVDTTAEAPVPGWWGDVESARCPIVHVTQGTFADQNPNRLVAPTLNALSASNVLVVASVDGERVKPLPINARAASFLPYGALLKRVAVLVTNGGYGGVQQALANGVPLVVAGASEDKPEVAARIVRSGAGLDLRSATPLPREIRSAVEEILGNPAYRRRALELSAEYQTHRPGPEAADVIESLLPADPRALQ